MNYFFEYHKAKLGLSDEAISLLEANMEEVVLKRNETFLDAGHLNVYVYFVSEGLVRCWFLRDGKEYTLNFAFEGDLAVLPPEGGRYSPVSATAIEDAVVMRISKERLEDLFAKNGELAFWGYQVLKTCLNYSIDDYLNLLWMDKQKTYLKLLEKHPDVLQRIPQKDVASFLNVTPSSLSRIRAGLKK